MKKVVIVNYGMGNIHSVQSAIKYLGYRSEYTNDPRDIINADKIILPGVGSFRIAMENISKSNIDLSLRDAVLSKQIPILGICLGMQLLGSSSTEDGITEGLGFFPGIVERFTSNSISNLKVPHVGFNNINLPNNSKLYNNIPESPDFYFVHSYKMKTNINEGVAICNYGEDFVASFEFDNIYGTQFHPEKSQKNGLNLLSNFIEL